MERFDAETARFEECVASGDIDAAVEIVLAACVHCRERNAAPEAPNLRDARCNLLAKCALSLPMQSANFPIVQTLMQRRIFSWLNGGRRCLSGFDNGFDPTLPVALEEYMEELADNGGQNEDLCWLRSKSDEVMETMRDRMTAVHTKEALRVGARIVLFGLANETYNGMKGTLTKQHGFRWGVHLDDQPKHIAVKTGSLKPLHSETYHCAQCRMEPSALEHALASLIVAAQSLEQDIQSAEVQARVDLAWRFLQYGLVSAPKCAATVCKGTGAVDFVDFIDKDVGECPTCTEKPHAGAVEVSRVYLQTGFCVKCQS
jgi:hypothetical protein